MAQTLYIEPKYGDEQTEVLLTHDSFPKLLEEFMGPDVRQHFDQIVDELNEEIITLKAELDLIDTDETYNDGYKDGYDVGFKNGMAKEKINAQ